MNNTINMSALKVFRLILENAKRKALPLVLLRQREINEESAYTGDFDFYLSHQYIDDFLKLVFELCAETATSFMVSRQQIGKIQVTLFDSTTEK